MKKVELSGNLPDRSPKVDITVRGMCSTERKQNLTWLSGESDPLWIVQEV